jgi:hypothetical protein
LVSAGAAYFEKEKDGDRCDQSSTVLTSQLAIKTWHQAIGEATIAELPEAGWTSDATKADAPPSGRVSLSAYPSRIVDDRRPTAIGWRATERTLSCDFDPSWQ